MKKELVKKWVEALRSGAYHQTKDTLCRVKGNQTFHCCLGVLCRVAQKDGIDIESKRSGDLVTFKHDGKTSVRGIELPLLNEIDLDSDYATDLANMNDEGKSFKQIADYIEDELINGQSHEV